MIEKWIEYTPGDKDFAGLTSDRCETRPVKRLAQAYELPDLSRLLESTLVEALKARFADQGR